MENEKKRLFGLTVFSLNNKNTIFLFTFIITIFGIFSYVKLPKELFPEVKFPSIFVSTVYPGNSPTDIEDLITRPIEKQIKSIKGVKDIKSTSVQDFSIITVEFNFGIDVKAALQDVKDAVDKSKNDLPSDLTKDPTVTDIDVSEFPVLNVNLSGDYNVSELRKYAEHLQDKFEAINEISSVNITGLNDREIQINVDPTKMEVLKISFNDIKNAISFENINMSGGELLVGGTRRSIKIDAQYHKTDEIMNTIVKSEKGNIVYLRDIAKVVDSFEEPKSFARLDGQNVVSLQVIKKSGENLLNAVDEIKNEVKIAQNSNYLPKDLRVSYTNDQSKNVKAQLNNLFNSLIMGFIFVVIVLYLFLGFRNALLVGLSIPTSLVLSFAILGVLGYTINMVILFSLILALGMLVDNAIVTVENIYRFIDKGYKIKDAAKYATSEIAVPIIASTATTLAAFFPLIFWKSMVGEFMKLLPITLIIVLSSSLFVALVIVPVFARQYIKENIKHETINKKKNYIIALILAVVAGLGYIFHLNTLANLLMLFAILGAINAAFLFNLSAWFKDVFLVKLENWYLQLINWSLKKRNPQWIMVFMVVLLVMSQMFYSFRSPKVDFFPITPPEYINIVATLPEGSDVKTTNNFMLKLEKKINKLVKKDRKYIESIQVTVGKGAHAEREATVGDTPNKGLITIKFIDEEYRTAFNTFDFVKKINKAVINQYPGVEMVVQKNRKGPPTGKAINMEISGDDLTQLIAISDSIDNIIHAAGIKGIQGLKLDITTDKPELLIHIDRDAAKRFGLSSMQIAATIRTSLFGQEVSKFKEGEDQYPINVRYNKDYRYDLDALLNQKITFRNKRGQLVQVPISSVASVEYNTSFGSVKRIDLKRVVTLASDVLEGYNANQINAQLREVIKNYKLPDNYSVSFTGEQKDQADSMAFMQTAMLIALSLILIILVTQFNSGVKPLIIMASILFSTIGVFGGLATFNMDFVVIMTGIGIISLAGVVVNNAIVLIDYVDYLKTQKKAELGLTEDDNLSIETIKDLIVLAGKTRLRPVLLTAITTILGLLPMAFGLNINFSTMFSEFNPHLYFGGSNAAFWSPMAWTVVFGLAFATLLTLVVVPVLYYLLNKTKLRFAKSK